jgi:hypothetical protein
MSIGALKYFAEEREKVSESREKVSESEFTGLKNLQDWSRKIISIIKIPVETFFRSKPPNLKLNLFALH